MAGQTFGGSALDRLLFDFEATGDGSDAGAGGEAGAGSSPDPAAGGDAGAAGEGAASSPATGAASAWSPDDPQLLEFVDSRAAELMQTQLAPIMPLLEQLFAADGAARGAAPAGAGFDPATINALDDDFGTQLVSLLKSERETTLKEMRQMLSGIAEPLAAREHAETVQQNQEVINNAVAADIERNGALTEKAKGLVDTLGVQLLPQFEAVYGKGSPRALEATVVKTTSILRDVVSEAKAAGVEEYKATLENVGNARNEPGSAGTGGAQGVPSGESPGEITRRYADRARALRVA